MPWHRYGEAGAFARPKAPAAVPYSTLTPLEQAASRRKSVAHTLQDMEDRQRAAARISLRLRLERAGLDITPRTFWLASVVCGAVLGCIVMVWLPASATRMFLTVVVTLIGVFGVPPWFVNKKTMRRQMKFTAELPWAHLDIAGTAWAEEARPYLPKGPTGVTVRTLTELAFTSESWK